MNGSNDLDRKTAHMNWRAALRPVVHAPFPADVMGRAAAIAVIVREHKGAPSVLLIRRAARAGDVWSGHVAMPGGRVEPADEGPVGTAARETLEEIGLDLALPGAHLCGMLPAMRPRIPGAPVGFIQPVVWELSEPHAAFAVEHQPGTSDEVDATGWVELAVLSSAGRHEVEIATGARIEVPGIQLPLGLLWGITLRVCEQLLADSA